LAQNLASQFYERKPITLQKIKPVPEIVTSRMYSYWFIIVRIAEKFFINALPSNYRTKAHFISKE